MRRNITSCLLLLPPALALLTDPLLADRRGGREREHRDRDEIREAVERHEVKPLDEVLATARGEIEGQIVGIEVERRHGAWVYELRVIAPDGRLLDVYVDAATAKIITIEED